MGIIYEKMRNNEGTEKILGIEETYKFINFYNFIELLKLYADDSKEVTINYLINDDDFLKLDFYHLIEAMADKNGVVPDEESMYEDYSTKIKDFPYTKLLHIHHSYDDYATDDPVSYPTEDFLEHLLEDTLDDNFIDMYWKVEDILELECIVSIGLNAEVFEEYIEAFNSDARETVSYIRQIKNLKEKLTVEQEKSAQSQNFDANAYDTAIKKLAEQNNQIKDLLSKIENLEKKSIPNNDKSMHPRTANVASKIIAALTSELLKMDLTQPFTADTNGRIKEAIERQGNTVSKDVIANWLKLAHENSI